MDPVPPPPPHTHARTDLLEHFNLSIPETWEELVEVARITNGTDSDDDGIPDYGFCQPGCMGYYPLSAVLMSLTQYRGTTSGGWIDPDTLHLLFNSTAMYQAAYYVQQVRHGCILLTFLSAAYYQHFLSEVIIF